MEKIIAELDQVLKRIGQIVLILDLSYGDDLYCE
jgi:hypothetical protein